MRLHRKHRVPGRNLPTLVLALIAGASACSDSDSSGIVAPSTEPPPPSFSEVGSLDFATCDVIDFDGFAHGDLISSVNVLGLDLTVTVTPGGSSSAPEARAYDTDNVGGVDFDLEWDGPDADCPDCEGLGRLIIINHVAGFPIDGDSFDGGLITLTGFTGNGDFFVPSFLAVDNDATEPPMTLRLDGVQVAASSQLGNGSVEFVSTGDEIFNDVLEFTVGTEDPNDDVQGSGGFDNIQICRQDAPPPPPTGGGEGCTPGYWKQPHHFDSWTAPYTPTTPFGDVFADAFPDKTMLQVLAQGGGGLKALGRHTVAALLNAASPDTDYDMTVAEVIAAFDAAFASGEYEATKDEFERLNEQGCPLN